VVDFLIRTRGVAFSFIFFSLEQKQQ